MSRTNELKKLIKEQLSGLCIQYGIKEVYFKLADSDKLYPHIVFDYETIMPYDGFDRHDYVICIDIFDKNNGYVFIDQIADSIEDLFNNKNLPQDSILPTFFIEDRRIVTDEDKNIKHILVKIVAQNYEREELNNG